MAREPQLKPLIDQLYGSATEAFGTIENQVGVSLPELLALPRGELTLALVDREEGPPDPIMLLGESNIKPSTGTIQAIDSMDESRIDVLTEDDETGVVRLRLVDTRTSIRLLDVLLPGQDLETQVAAIREELRDASATLEVPADQLRLIGLVPISSGEPGEFCVHVTRYGVLDGDDVG